MELTALIPARGGSKRIPGKNLANLGGRPLVAWTIEAALKADCVDRVVVSTEDPEIAAVAREWGAEVLDRPPELAEDDVPTRKVTHHAIEALGLSGYVALLHPTSPFRSEWDIERAWQIAIATCQTVVSFTNDELNGAIYIARAAELKRTHGSFFYVGSIVPYVMPPPSGLDIDTPEDLERARARDAVDTTLGVTMEPL